MSLKSFLVVVIVLVCSIHLRAQDISELKLVGKPEIASGEFIGNEVRDANGEIAAGIIFLTDLESLSFEPRNGAVKIRSEAGQYLLYLSPTERIVTVRSSGFKPLTLYLNDIGIRLKSSEVWKVTITGSKVGDLVPINVVVNQPDAKVLLDGAEVDHSKAISTSLGTHTLRIEKQQYKTIVETIEVTKEKTLFQYQMKSVDLQVIDIRSTPSDASVSLNGQYVGQTPYQDFKFPGIYELSVSKPGFKTINQTIEITEDATFSRSLNLQKTVATLILNVIPSNASVKVNNKDYSGYSTIELAAGSYVVEVSKTGYETYRETITVKELEQVTKNITLKQQLGNLLFRVNNPEASISLSGNGINRSWKGLTILRDIPAGTYTIRASLTGYVDIVEQVNIRGNETTEWNMTFSDQQKQAYIEEQNRLHAQQEARRLEEERKKRVAQLAEQRKREQMFKPKSYTSLGVGYGNATFTAKGMEVVGEVYSYGTEALKYDGSHITFNMDYFTSSEEDFFNGDSYDSFEGLTFNFGYGYGVHVGSLYSYVTGLAQFISVDLDGESAEYINVLDLGFAYRAGAMLNLGGIIIGVDYSQQVLNTLDTITYDRLAFKIGIEF